jgi:hypothetical protein
MATIGAVQANASGPGASKLSKGPGPQGIRDEILRLREAGLLSIPVHLFWNGDEGKKDADFPHKWCHLTDSKSWENSIEAALEQRAHDANGVAILTGPSHIYVIDVDVTVKKKNGTLPGMDLWSQLIARHGEPQTLKARSGSGGQHFFLRLLRRG